MTGVAFDRRYELTLAKPIVGRFFGTQPNALVVRGMEIKFKVERSLEPTPNTCQVSVYNLADATRAEFDKKPLHVRLDVGYATDNQLSRLIEGDLLFSPSKRVDQDIVTTFTAADGERAWVDARVNVSFAAGVDIKTAIGAIADSMGLKVPKNASDVGALLKQFGTGMSLRGPSRVAMSKMLKGTGVGWSMQDGVLQLLRDEDSRAGLIELVSPANGLIGSPDYNAPKKPGDPPVLKFKCRLRPRMIPGGRVKVQSAEINGAFKLIKLTHTGDFRDDEWYTEVEAHPL